MNRSDALLDTLQARFLAHPYRHPGVSWDAVASLLAGRADWLESVRAMEESGGEPDVVLAEGVPPSAEPGAGIALSYCDCSPESPEGRRSFCYDDRALDSRKANKPSGSALGFAAARGLSVLAEAEYRTLQRLEGMRLDLKTSSWILTPEAIRERGGALFCDCRYGHVFTYHNGAESYYAVRGVRCRLALA